VVIGNRKIFKQKSGARSEYPESSFTDGIHDPGQSWNAVTVGAYTEKVMINEEDFQGWNPIASVGTLSPSSCTSMIWEKKWPLKPDIVMEGGNMAINPASGTPDYLDSLQLLTTYWQPTHKPLVTTGDTSAATALAARMAAIIQAYYPDFLPETIRALMIHSSRWTNSMLESFPGNNRNARENLLKCYGFGAPSLSRALWSAGNSLTMIIQNELQPYEKSGDNYKTRDMHLHPIPWPEEVLLDLRETPVTLRVTLSYFIEPSPGRKGWQRRHRYASHGLRFDVKTSTETVDDFRFRINKAARDGDNEQTSSSDTSDWLIGPQLRGRGSVHSDIWRGLAADLATKNILAVYPVIGWWRERHQLGRLNNKARYSLIVTIETPEIDVDIYTPVANQIGIPIPIDIE